MYAISMQRELAKPKTKEYIIEKFAAGVRDTAKQSGLGKARKVNRGKEPEVVGPSEAVKEAIELEIKKGKNAVKRTNLKQGIIERMRD